MIRILHVVTHMNRGGLESMIMNYYRTMDRSVMQFDFLTHREYDGDYGDEIVSLGGKIYHLPRMNPFDKKYKKTLRKFLQNHQEYNIIHVHQDCMSSIVLKEAKRCGIQTRIAHSHSSSQDKNIKYLIKCYYKGLIPKYATHLFACGEQAGNWMFGGAKFDIVNNAINTKYYTYDEKTRVKKRQELKIGDSITVIGHVGRFSYPKNHEFLINVFSKIVELHDDYRLLLVGDGEHRERIEHKVKENNLMEKVIFTGLRSDVAELMQAMDVFVFPSRYEGLPVTLVEAQAAGLPCVISDKVPIECKKTDLVQQISLDTDIDIWADTIIAASCSTRMNTYEQIKNSGYDIKENARKLQEFYMKADAGEKNVCLH